MARCQVMRSGPARRGPGFGPWHRIRRVAVVVIGAATMAMSGTVLAPSSSAAPTSEVATADTTVTVACAGTPVPVRVRWYIPRSTPGGLVWLQHGFARSAQNLDGLAKAYAAQGLLVAGTTVDSISVTGCSVAYNVADNTAFVDAMASVFGAADHPNSALSQSLRRADALTHRDVTMPSRMLFSGHSAGGEFVLTAANDLRRSDPAGYRRLRGLMLLDPVNSFLGNNFRAAATELGQARLPIRIISSPPSISNIFSSGVRVLEQQTRQPFLGAQLTTGVHIDAEGDSTDIVGIASELAVPQPRNVRVLRTLAPHWAADLISGHVTPAFYPGGNYYQLLLRTNTITTLPTG